MHRERRRRKLRFVSLYRTTALCSRNGSVSKQCLQQIQKKETTAKNRAYEERKSGI